MVEVVLVMRGILLFDFPSVSSVTLLINVVMFKVFIFIRGIFVFETFVFEFKLEEAAFINVLLIGIIFCNEMSLNNRLFDVRILASFLRIISFTLSILFNVLKSSLVVKQILFLIAVVVVVVVDVDVDVDVTVVVMGLLGDTYIVDELK